MRTREHPGNFLGGPPHCKGERVERRRRRAADLARARARGIANIRLGCSSVLLNRDVNYRRRARAHCVHVAAEKRGHVVRACDGRA